MEEYGKLELEPRQVALATQVKHIQMQRAFDKKYAKIEFAFQIQSQAEEGWIAIHAALALERFYVLHAGKAPKGELERLMQSYLEDHGKTKKKEPKED